MINHMICTPETTLIVQNHVYVRESLLKLTTARELHIFEDNKMVRLDWFRVLPLLVPKLCFEWTSCYLNTQDTQNRMLNIFILQHLSL